MAHMIQTCLPCVVEYSKELPSNLYKSLLSPPAFIISPFSNQNSLKFIVYDQHSPIKCPLISTQSGSIQPKDQDSDLSVGFVESEDRLNGQLLLATDRKKSKEFWNTYKE